MLVAHETWVMFDLVEQARHWTHLPDTQKIWGGGGGGGGGIAVTRIWTH